MSPIGEGTSYASLVDGTFIATNERALRNLRRQNSLKRHTRNGWRNTTRYRAHEAGHRGPLHPRKLTRSAERLSTGRDGETLTVPNAAVGDLRRRIGL